MSFHLWLCWDAEARAVGPHVHLQLIICFGAEVQTVAVYNLRLSGCSSTAAAKPQLSSCCCSASQGDFEKRKSRKRLRHFWMLNSKIQKMLFLFSFWAFVLVEEFAMENLPSFPGREWSLLFQTVRTLGFFFCITFKKLECLLMSLLKDM